MHKHHLIQPKQYLPLIDNYNFAISYAMSNYKSIEYMMNFAGDDELLNDNYLSTLINWLEKNPTYQAVSPTIVNYSYKFNTKSEVKPSLSSKFRFLRVLKFSTRTSNSGFINLVNGLMHSNSYKNLMDLLYSCSKLESLPTNQRPIRSEYIAFLDFAENNRVGHCHSVKLLKEIHNRDNYDIRTNFRITRDVKVSQIKNAKHQILSIAWPIKAFIFFKPYLSINKKIYLFVYSNLYFITNLLDLILKKLKKISKNGF